MRLAERLRFSPLQDPPGTEGGPPWPCAWDSSRAVGFVPSTPFSYARPKAFVFGVGLIFYLAARGRLDLLIADVSSRL
jgi:hypothetical protein